MNIRCDFPECECVGPERCEHRSGIDLSKYKTSPELLQLLADSAERVKNMSEQELAEMYKLQRQSWARQDMD